LVERSTVGRRASRLLFRTRHDWLAGLRMADLRPWEILGSQIVSSDRWLTHTLEHVRLPNGLEIPQYHVLNQNDFCLMVAVTPDGEVPLVRQYKHGARDVVLEFPAGLVEDDETPEAAASRELLEETGYAGRMYGAGTLLTGPSRNRNLAHIFVVMDAEWVNDPSPDETEQIEVVLIPIAQVPGLIADGAIRDLGSLATYARVRTAFPELGWEC
jgi:8-oxo-dGTP pyrophosphatase MutT (NUDIX family)